MKWRKQEQNGRSAPVFVYQFSHPTEVPGFPACSGSSCHTAELPFVFNNVSIVEILSGVLYFWPFCLFRSRPLSLILTDGRTYVTPPSSHSTKLPFYLIARPFIMYQGICKRMQNSSSYGLVWWENWTGKTLVAAIPSTAREQRSSYTLCLVRDGKIRGKAGLEEGDLPA